MHLKALILLSVTLALTACGRDASPSSNDIDTVAVDNLAMGNAPEPATLLPATGADFVKATAASDRFEIESSKLAATAAQSTAVKTFASQMIKSHNTSTTELKTLVAGISPTLDMDDALNSGQQGILASLQGKTGAEFDRAYAVAQVSAHEKTLEALTAYAAVGDNAILQQYAKDLVPTVTAHLETAKELNKELK